MEIEPLLDELETDAVNRRIKRMTGAHLADVTQAFISTNMGTEQLFTAIHEHFKPTDTLDVNGLLDWTDALLTRDRLTDD
jgi:hypothetical protein